jgi:protein-disulfide isomerase/uncharacterized membrane protein
MEQTDVQTPHIFKQPVYKLSRVFCVISILLGLLVSAYLLKRYTNISAENSSGKIDVCSTLFGKGCDSALTSQMSTQFGLPLSAWGIIFYAALILFLIMPFIFGKTFKPLANFLLYSLCLVGFLAAIVLLSAMIISPKLFCPFCSVIHVLNILLFFLLPRVIGFNRRAFFAVLKDGLQTFFSKQFFSSANLWKGFGFFTILFLLASGYFGLRILAGPAAGSEPAFIDFKPVLKEYKSQPVKTIPIEPDDPSFGLSDSKIQVVVFSDFFCTGCKQFYYDLKNIMDSSKGQYHIVFKNFPLDKKCNPFLKEDLHKGACEAALAAAAANRQGKFWPFHDALFTADKTANDERLQENAISLGLNMQEFNAYRNSDSAKAKLVQDIAMAGKLGVHSTPTVFLNGRQVKDLRKGFLKLLIKEEIKKSSFNIY